jgi:hypothetical protein
LIDINHQKIHHHQIETQQINYRSTFSYLNEIPRQKDFRPIYKFISAAFHKVIDHHSGQSYYLLNFLYFFITGKKKQYLLWKKKDV